MWVFIAARPETGMTFADAATHAVEDRRADLEAAALGDWAGEIDRKFQAIFEACSFQDITGQSVSQDEIDKMFD